MESVLLVIHLIATLSLIGLIMLQRSEGGGLGIGGGSGGMGALAGAHTTANMLTRATAVLATVFFITNLSLAYLAKVHTSADSVIDQISIEMPAVPTEEGGEAVVPTPSEPVVPIVE